MRKRLRTTDLELKDSSQSFLERLREKLSRTVANVTMPQNYNQCARIKNGKTNLYNRLVKTWQKNKLSCGYTDYEITMLHVLCFNQKDYVIMISLKLL